MELDRSADPPPAIWVATTKSTVNKWVSEPLYQMLAKYQMLSVSMTQSIQSLSRVWLFATPWTAAHQTSLSITNSRSLLKLISIESVMPSNHLVLRRPCLLLPSVLPSFRVFSKESALRIRWPKYWSLSFSSSPSNECSRLISFRMDWFDLEGLSRVFSNTTVQKHQFFSAQPSLWSNSYIHSWILDKL